MKKILLIIAIFITAYWIFNIGFNKLPKAPVGQVVDMQQWHRENYCDTHDCLIGK